jgi:Zn-dependent protease/CBS domain-containing protein
MADQHMERKPRRGGIDLFSVGGIRIRIDYSWFFVFLLVVWSLSAGYLPAQYPGESTATYWAGGVVATLLFFLSILVHELAHSFVAIHYGIAIPDITLFIFGGVSRLSEEATDAATEFKIAVVGPITSFAVAAVVWLVGNQLVSGPSVAQAVVTYLAWINLALGLFNLVPGYPLDGGRILRAIWWHRSGSLLQATRIASDVGKGFAAVLMVLGAVEIFTGALLGGLWLIFIGMFLRGVAQAGYQQAVLTRWLEGMRVRDVQLEQTPSVPPEMPLRELVDDYFFRYGLDGFPVVGKEGEALGVVTLQNVKDVPEARRGEVRVRDVMTHFENVPVLRLDTHLTEALNRFQEGASRLLVVDEDHEVRGMLSQNELLRRMEIRQSLET